MNAAKTIALCAILPLVAAGALYGNSAARAQAPSDPIPLTPYGMDPVPPTVFYQGPWNLYGSDPTPQSATSDLGFHDAYGLDPIPDAVIPSLRELRHVLPIQELQVLTSAIENGDSTDFDADDSPPPRCP